MPASAPRHWPQRPSFFSAAAGRAPAGGEHAWALWPPGGQCASGSVMAAAHWRECKCPPSSHVRLTCLFGRAARGRHGGPACAAFPAWMDGLSACRRRSHDRRVHRSRARSARSAVQQPKQCGGGGQARPSRRRRQHARRLTMCRAMCQTRLRPVCRYVRTDRQTRARARDKAVCPMRSSAALPRDASATSPARWRSLL